MADSKNKKTESEERSPTFTRAMLGRVLAVALFVILGTFVVATFMRGEKQIVVAEPVGDVKTETLVASGPAKPVVQGTFLASKKPKVSDSFGTTSATTAPKVPAVSTSFARKPFQASKPKVGASPVSSRSSFGGRPTSPPPIKPVQSNITKVAVGGPASQAKTPSIQNGFDAFKTKVVKTSGDLANRARDSVRDTAQKTNFAIDRSLNGLGARTSGTQPSKPFSKPAVKAPVRPTFDRNRLTASAATKPQSQVGSSTKETKPVASFDASRNLKPFSRQSSNSSRGGGATGSGFGASFGQQNNPPKRPLVSNPSRPIVPVSKPRVAERTVNSNSSRPTSRSIAATPRSPAPVSVAARTSDSPGDRELEGVQAPALTVEKIAPREIQVNREAEFAIVVRNVGRAMARDVRVFDEVPAGTQFVASVPEASRSGQRLDWKIGELRPGQEKRIKVQLKPTRPGEIGSVAHVTFATQATMRTRVTKPVLEIRHSARPQALIGDPVVFDVVVENKGDGPATNVIVQEDVPKQLEYADGYRELEYEIGTLMPGQSKRVKLGLKAAQIGRLRNVMFASASGGLRAKHEIDMEIVAPKLAASTEGATRRFLKRDVEHNFSVENNGTAKATNVELIARLPSGLRFVSANNQGRYDRNSHAVYWSLAELQPSIKAGVALKTMPVEVGKQDIKFEALADLNQKSNATQPLSVEHLVDVFFDIDDVVDPIEIGSDTSYRIRIVNQGTKTASNVKLAVDFPNGMRPTGVEGNLRNEVRGQQVLFAPISTLSPGDEIAVIVRSQGTAAGDHRVSVNLQTDGRQTQVTKQETTRVYADR